jgi:hypothetical protein
VTALAAHPDSEHLFVAYQSGAIRVHNVPRNIQVVTPSQYWHSCPQSFIFAFQAFFELINEYLLVLFIFMVWFLQIRHRVSIHQPRESHVAGSPTCANYSSSGDLIAVGCDDGRVFLLASGLVHHKSGTEINVHVFRTNV